MPQIKVQYTRIQDDTLRSEQTFRLLCHITLTLFKNTKFNKIRMQKYTFRNEQIFLPDTT